MEILPAIDLKGGRCVRLVQGRADDETVYSDDPVAMARHWVELGAGGLHIVDLDGAFRGAPAHAGVIADIVEAVDVPVEVGGGLRTVEDVARLVDLGVSRAIVGTRALVEPDVLGEWVRRFGLTLAVGIDARDGMVSVSGWTEASLTPATDFARTVCGAGVATIIYTDISRDGMLQGCNVEATDQICDVVTCGVIASGGVSTVGDVQSLVSLGRTNLVGAIVGKALYEDSVQLEALIAAAGG
ncbi:MAG: 1-(5-phosphoribosyl)-5-[(5-phosphoribosylamino)methylideneamino]imidazole-4-carboxamide isomerase [Lentisphaerae bacterium]|nr:1-(5-phosphoribosyl)-5-[(5-phosphoribosylamino)methylideneamino]imidazole-4-carboxamide isomerase [Lentisphaerota bacterium]